MSYPNIISTSSYLDDDYPSLVFVVSCLVGYPEPNAWGNLGVDLLTKPSFGPSAGIVSGSRVIWVSLGGGELLSYEFNHYLIDGPGGPEKIGNALYDSKFFCNQNYSWDHYSEYWNMFTYNLYGDPALKREGIEPTTLCGDVNSDWGIDLSDVIHLANYLLKSGDPPPQPIYRGNANGDDIINLSDVIYIANYYLEAGPAPHDCENYQP